MRRARPWDPLLLRAEGTALLRALGIGMDDSAGTPVVSKLLRSEAPAATVLRLRRTRSR